MKVAEIRESSAVVICSNNERTVVALYKDNQGMFIMNESLKKEYIANVQGHVYDSTFLGS